MKRRFEELTEVYVLKIFYYEVNIETQFKKAYSRLLQSQKKWEINQVVRKMF